MNRSPITIVNLAPVRFPKIPPLSDGGFFYFLFITPLQHEERYAILFAVNQTRTKKERTETMTIEAAKKFMVESAISEEGYVAVLNEDTKCPFFMKAENVHCTPHCDLAANINVSRMFATEDECRRAVEEVVGRYNASMEEYNVLMRAKGITEVPLKNLKDYLIKIVKVRYVRKVEVV